MAYSGTSAPGGTPATPYTPGEHYDATRGITLAQFESLEGMAKSVPVERGFFVQPQAIIRSIIVVNLCGKDICSVLNKDKKVDKNLPAARENEKELNAFFLPNGESSHFVVPPHCYNISVSEWVNSENGNKKLLTREGFSLYEVANKIVTYIDGDTQGLVEDNVKSADLGQYAWFSNQSSVDLLLKVTKTSTAYQKPAEQIMKEKQSRNPDNGGEVIRTVNIEAGGTWHFKSPPRCFTVRAIETPRDEYGNDDDLMGRNDHCPTQNDYVELACSTARGGDVVVFLAGTGRNAGIMAKTYRAGEVKFVNSDIVLTSRVAS